MTTLTIKINKSTKAGKAFMAMAETFFKDAEGIEIVETESSKSGITAKEKAFYERVEKSVIEAKEIAAGKRKGKSFQSLLDEL